MSTLSPYLAAMREARARSYAIDVMTARSIEAALRQFANELEALIRALPLDRQLAAQRSVYVVNHAAGHLELRIERAIREGTTVAFDDTLRVWESAMQRVAGMADVPNNTLGAVHVPQLTIAQTFNGERTTGTFRSLLRAHTGNTAADVASITRRALLDGTDPDTLARALKPYVTGRDRAPDAIKSYIVDTPVETRAAAYTMEHNATRIAFSETHVARKEAEVAHFQRDPFIALGRWTLSPNRGTQRLPDVCDALAKLDWWGLGPGVFPLERIPDTPHPWDRCEVMPLTWTPELRALLAKRGPVLTLLLNPESVPLPGEEFLTPRAAVRTRMVLAMVLKAEPVRINGGKPTVAPPTPPKLTVVPPTLAPTPAPEPPPPPAEPAPSTASPFADRVRFNTWEEARDHANNTLGAQLATSAPQPRVWGKQIKSDKARLAQAEVIVSELDALYKRFPNVPRATKRIYATHPKRGRAHLAGPGHLTVNEPRTPEQLKNIQAWESKNGKRWGVGHHKDAEWQQRAIVRHEFAHNLTTAEVSRRWEDLIAKLASEGKLPGGRKAWFKQHVSDYSATKPVEEIAETVALVTEPDYANGSLPREMEDFVLKYLFKGE